MSPRPEQHREKVTLDRVSACRLKPGRQAPRLQDWAEHLEKYPARQAKRSKGQ